MSAEDTIKKKEKIIEKFLSQLEEFVSRIPVLYRFLKKCKVKYQRFKYAFMKNRDNHIDLIFNRTFFKRNLDWNVPIAGIFVDLLMRHFHPLSVVDVGCGNAEFLAEFKKRNVAIKGYEGSRHALDSALVDRKFIELFDLKNTIQETQKYDLVLCLEVAEHIESEFSQKLVENVTSLGDVIVFTAATPGQGGHFHMNEQHREFWINLLSLRNFALDSSLTEVLKKEMKDRGLLQWYYDNVMVYKRN